MNSIDLFNLVEQRICSHYNYFEDLHIINNKVVGFYKTKYVRYKDKNDKSISYLFPTTFEIEDDKIKTTIIFGSVERDFEVEDVNGTGFDTYLETFSVGNHLYKLLGLIQYDELSNNYLDYRIKPIVCVIESLNAMKFPFMRIANNKSIEKYSDLH